MGSGVLADGYIGLDSQTAWSICVLLRKLADNGQAILCTIHQPSAILFQGFDRLLFLAMGGKTLYFGEIGESSQTLTDYFRRNGARPCRPDENPAEWMLDVTGAVPGSENTQDWPTIWNNSEEHKAVKAELVRMRETLPGQSVLTNDPDALRPFAAPLGAQFGIVLRRVFQQYWRTPSYIYPKVALCLFSVCMSLSRVKDGLSNAGPGNVYWIFFLENAQLASRIAKPTFRCLHAPYHLLQLLSANHAPFHNPARSLRSSRTSVQNLFLESVHLIKHRR